MENVKAIYILMLFAAFMVPLILFFCVCVYCGLATKRRSMRNNQIMYSIATADYFQYKPSENGSAVLFTGALIVQEGKGDQRQDSGRDEFYAFPEHFIWCFAKASYQIERSWNSDGKGESIWNNLVHTNLGAIKDRTTGGVACDSCSKYKEDVRLLLKEVGVDFYRFSIASTRILPDGWIWNVNQEGIGSYNNLIHELLANGIHPIVSLFHWDYPQRLKESSGYWDGMEAAYLFANFSRIAFSRFGDRVKYRVTFNEPLYGLNAWPLYNGDYHSEVRKLGDEKNENGGRSASRLPTFNDRWKQILTGANDFLGLNPDPVRTNICKAAEVDGVKLHSPCKCSMEFNWIISSGMNDSPSDLVLIASTSPTLMYSVGPRTQENSLQKYSPIMVSGLATGK